MSENRYVLVRIPVERWREILVIIEEVCKQPNADTMLKDATVNYDRMCCNSEHTK